MHRDRWSRPVIAAATEVHRILGPGLPETVYKVALAEELRRRSIPFERDKTVPIRYRISFWSPGSISIWWSGAS